MKFNYSELAAYCNSKKGKADKEGTLWLKERSEGLFTKRECQCLSYRVSQIQIVLCFL